MNQNHFSISKHFQMHNHFPPKFITWFSNSSLSSGTHYFQNPILSSNETWHAILSLKPVQIPLEKHYMILTGLSLVLKPFNCLLCTICNMLVILQPNILLNELRHNASLNSFSIITPHFHFNLITSFSIILLNP